MSAKKGKVPAPTPVAHTAGKKVAKPAKRVATREDRYKQLFGAPAPAVFVDCNEFIPQVHGYGEPVFAEASYYSGV